MRQCCHFSREYGNYAIAISQILALSRNLCLCASVSGYCRSACKVEFSFRKCSCMMRPNGSWGWICSYRTKRDWGKSLAAHLMMSSDLEEHNVHELRWPQMDVKSMTLWLGLLLSPEGISLRPKIVPEVQTEVSTFEPCKLRIFWKPAFPLKVPGSFFTSHSDRFSNANPYLSFSKVLLNVDKNSCKSNTYWSTWSS